MGGCTLFQMDRAVKNIIIQTSLLNSWTLNKDCMYVCMYYASHAALICGAQCLSVCHSRVSVCLSDRLSQWSVCLSVCVTRYMASRAALICGAQLMKSICLSVHPSVTVVCLSVCLFVTVVCLCVCLSVRPSVTVVCVCLSIRLSQRCVCLSICVPRYLTKSCSTDLWCTADEVCLSVSVYPSVTAICADCLSVCYYVPGKSSSARLRCTVDKVCKKFSFG